MRTSTFAGRLGADAELGATPDGTPVVNFSLAVDTKRKGGEKTTMWVKGRIWRERAEKVHRYLKKGTFLVISGYPHTEAWIDKTDGKARSQIVLDVTELTFGGGGDREEAQASSHGRVQPSGDFDDDIPF